MKKNLFDFNDYRAYFHAAFPTKGPDRGGRQRLATALGVQKGFISAVLHGNGELSLEQAYRASRFLLHSEQEREYFLLLVQKARAGSKELSSHFAQKLQEILAKRREIHERISVKAELSETDKLIYYSTWHYGAIHMCLRVPALQTPAAMMQYLGLAPAVVSRVLDFFLRIGLAEQQGNRFLTGPVRLHIPSDSPFIAKHHINWRMQAMQALDRSDPNALHFSSAMSISADAAEKIRNILLAAIQNAEPVIRDAKDEGVYVLAMDLFAMKASL